MDSLLRLFSSPRRLRSNRDQLGIDPAILNRIEPPGVIDQIDEAVRTTLLQKWPEEVADHFASGASWRRP